jgi:hypothetical protein
MCKDREYKSPTTPGLHINFANYIVELVCLNMDNKLSPRFWSGSDYWKKKYAREISVGVKRLKQDLASLDFEENIVKAAVVKAIEKTRIKSLLVEKTRNKFVRRFYVEHKHILKQRSLPVKNVDHKIDEKSNSKFVDPPQKTSLRKIREIETNG